MADPQEPNTPKKAIHPSNYDEASHFGFLMEGKAREMDKSDFFAMIIQTYIRALKIKIQAETIHNSPRLTRGGVVPFFERYSVGNLANLKKSLVKKAGEERAEYDCKVQEIYHGLDALLEGSWQSFDQYVGTVEKLEAVDATLAEREAEMRKEK